MPPLTDDETAARAAAAQVRGAAGLLVGAGAGMGVGSGLPDFRGPAGFWRAYPALGRAGVTFQQMADPRWFRSDPRRAWGFYGHRLNLYRATTPHAGFGLLADWAAAAPAGGFVFTSNVDGQFQAAGWDPDRVVECHGSIHHLQCLVRCTDDLWPADGVTVDVDEGECRARGPLPSCPRCGLLARPNVLMFGDAGWLPGRTGAQERRYAAWLRGVPSDGLTAVEVGAGTAVATVRRECERRAGRLVRINPRDAAVPPGGVALRDGALAALRRVDAALRGLNRARG